MDAHALLTSQGWRGHGHTLHASNDKIGILNPILVAHKKDNSGLGAGKATVDQWWLSVIDEQLKGLDTSKGKPVQMVSGGVIGRMDQRYARTGLYENFVRGEILGSTIQEKTEVIGERGKKAKKEASESGSSSRNDSKSDSESEMEKKSKNSSKSKASDKETKAEKGTREAEKKARKAAKDAKKETKTLRRAARAEQNKLKAAKRADKEAMKKEKEVRRTKKLEKRKGKA